MSWTVTLKRKVEKAVKKLPDDIGILVTTLAKDIEANGPFRANWANYGKLSDGTYHCHLQKGKPTYVACWEVKDKKTQIVEVYYVGTHEKAPY